MEGPFTFQTVHTIKTFLLCDCKVGFIMTFIVYFGFKAELNYQKCLGVPLEQKVIHTFINIKQEHIELLRRTV